MQTDYAKNNFTAKSLKIMRKNSINYVCDYQSDIFLEKKTKFEYYKHI